MFFRTGDVINIRIKKKDIQKGKCSAPSNCPTAHALIRKMRKLNLTLGRNPLGTTISVGNFTSTVYLSGSTVYFRNPPALTEWISRFDSGEDPEPTRFQLEVKDCYEI